MGQLVKKEYLLEKVRAAVENGERAWLRVPDSNGFTLGDRLHAARLTGACCSRPDFAVLLGIHRVTVWRYEKGELASIDVELVERWAKLCGVSAKWLLTGRGICMIPMSYYRLRRD